MAEVSVIVTNYNYGKFLVQALESVLNQDYPQDKLEIILIDDASTDKATRRLVESYEHPRVKKILLSENAGVVKARNMAIEQAGGGVYSSSRRGRLVLFRLCAAGGENAG